MRRTMAHAAWRARWRAIRTGHPGRHVARAGWLRDPETDTAAQLRPGDPADGAHGADRPHRRPQRRRRRLPAEAVWSRRTAGAHAGRVAARGAGNRAIPGGRGRRRAGRLTNARSVARGRRSSISPLSSSTFSTSWCARQAAWFRAMSWPRCCTSGNPRLMSARWTSTSAICGRKLERGDRVQIRTVRGVGYFFAAVPEEAA